MQERNTYRLRKILIIVYIIYLAVYCALDVVLGLCDIEFRTWFKVVSLLYLWLYPVVGIGYLVFAWRERKIEEYRVQRAGGMQGHSMAEDRAFRYGTGLFLFAYGIVMTLVSFFMLVLMIFTVDSEKRLENGILRVEKAETMYGGSYEYYEPVAFFFREKTDWEEYPGNRYGESGINDSVPQDTEVSGNEEIESGQEDSVTQNVETSDNQETNANVEQDHAALQDTEPAINSEQEETETDIEKIKHPNRNQVFMEEFQEKKDNARYLNVYDGDRPLADAVWLIYEKHYIDNPNSESEAPSFYYNAKGNFYAKVMQKEYSCVLLVYNGMSENGKCQLFVAEEEHYDVNGNPLDSTSLLEFYAVNLEEGQVYEAHKTTWGGAESEEYKKATKE